MIKKLLNKKNLIIILIIAFIGIFCMQTPVYAATSFSDYIKESVLGIYELSRYICIFVLFVVAVACFINVFISKTPRAQALFKRTVTYIIVGLVAIVFLTYIIDAMFVINDTLLENCENLGKKISQIDSENNEITMYDSAISKAYELRASSGFIGMFLYVILVYYCAKFFVIYLRRYINIMILILVSPWVITRHVILKTFRGTSGKVGLWAKEMIFNIFIQALHAVIYASLIGLTLRLSDTFLSFIGVILTLVVFSFMSTIEKLIRRLFNFVGGSSSVKSSNTESIKDFATHPVQTTKERVNSFVGSVKEIPSNVSNGVINFKENVGTYMGDISSAINGENLNVSQEEIKQQQESMDAHPNMMKVENAIKSTPKNIKTKIKKITTSVKKIKNNITKFSSKELKVMKTRVKKVKQIYNNDLEVVKRISRFFIHYKDRRAMAEKVESGTATPEETELVAQFSDVGSLDDEVKEMEKAIEGSNDLVGEVYKIMGPLVFILPEKVGGSPYLGMVVLRSSNEFEKEMREDVEEAAEPEEKRTLKLPTTAKSTQQNNKTKKNRSNESKNKRYSFEEFSLGSVDTITNYLMIQTLLQDETVYSLMMVRAKMNETDLVPVGRVEIEGANTETEEVEEISRGVVKEYKTMTLKSKTTREDLLEIQAQRDNSIKEYKGISAANDWAGYVSSSKNVTRIMNEQSLQSKSKQSEKMTSDSTQQSKEHNKSDQIFSGVVVATAMRNDVALENVNVRNDLALQDEFITNLARYGIVSEEAKTEDVAREQAIQRLEDKIQSLTTDDRETYFKMAADFSDMAEKAGIEIGNENKTTGEVDENIIDVPYREVNEETKESKRTNMFEGEVENSNKVENEQNKNKKEKVNFKQNNVDPVNFVEDVANKQELEKQGSEAGKEVNNSSANDTSALIQTINKYLEGYVGKVVDAAIEFGEYGNNEKETNNVVESTNEMETVSNSNNEGKASTVSKAYNTIPFNHGITSGNKNKNGSSSDRDKDEKQDFLKYDIYGEVVKQGRYSLKPLPKGGHYTIKDAIEKAGGVTADADVKTIDQDAILENGMRIRIPKKPNTVEEEESNTVEEEELEKKCETIIKRIIATYVAKENIKDYSLLRDKENSRELLRLARKELEDADDKLIKNTIENEIKKREVANKYLFSNSKEKQKAQAEEYRKVQKTNETETKLREQEQAEKIQELLVEALRNLDERRAVIIGDSNGGNNAQHIARRNLLNRAAG